MARAGRGRRAGRGWFSPTAFADIAAFVYAALRLNLGLAVVAPLWAVLMFAVNPLRSFPLLLIAGIASAPGVGAAFAAFRDWPAFAVGLGRRGDEGAGGAGPDGPAPDWLAPSRWLPGEEGRFLVPFARAYRATFWRSLGVGAIFWGAALVLLVDAVWAMREPWGVYVIPALAVLGVLALAAGVVGLVVAVDLPRARWSAIVRTAAWLSLRKWYFSLANLLVGGLLLWGLQRQTILVAALVPSLALYVLWANARWMAKPVRDALLAE